MAKSFKSVLALSDDFGQSYDNVVFSINSLEALKKQPKNRRIHLKIDSGMHRNGVAPQELGYALSVIKTNNLLLEGVFSHLRGADELNSSQFWQEKNFETARAFINDFCAINAMQKPKYHLHNSAGALRKSDLSDYDFIRPGIALYGYMDSPVIDVDLKPVLALHAQKVSSKEATSAMRFGYGGCGKSSTKRVCVYDIGYADGFWRFNENNAYITPNGAKLVGKVSMDSCFIESDEDEICLMDNAAYVANIAGTISYDVLVKLNRALERKAL